MRLLNRANEVLWRFVLPICGVAVGITAMVIYIGSGELVLAIVWGTVVVLNVLILWLANRSKARKQWRETDGVVEEEPGPGPNGE
jgi:ABC-type transport system involved in cytochrome bd biosynthesis fused ATPase/permease subunit